MDNSAARPGPTLLAGGVAGSTLMGRPPSSDLEFARGVAELWEDDAQTIGFHPRLFCQLALPYKDPGELPFWERRNGDFSLTVRPAIETAEDGRRRVGYPFGHVPRLLLSWIATEVNQPWRQPTPELVLGESLADFMRQLGLGAPSGGRSGNITRLRKQMNRLLDASITAEYHGDVRRDVGKNFMIAAGKSLWWSSGDRNADQRSLLPSTIHLSQEFFDELVEHPVPVDLRALRMLRDSPMRLDIYTWLTHRSSYAKRRSNIKWEQLRAQFGSNSADTRQGRARFREHFRDNLAYVLEVYRDARVDVETEGVVVYPAPPHVRRRSLST